MIFYILFGILMWITIVSIASMKNPAPNICIGILSMIYVFIAIKFAPSLINALLLGLIIITMIYLYIPESKGGSDESCYLL